MTLSDKSLKITIVLPLLEIQNLNLSCIAVRSKDSANMMGRQNGWYKRVTKDVFTGIQLIIKMKTPWFLVALTKLKLLPIMFYLGCLALTKWQLLPIMPGWLGIGGEMKSVRRSWRMEGHALNLLNIEMYVQILLNIGICIELIKH